MFLTVTPNAVLDKTIFIEAFQPSTYMQASRVAMSVGGKALDASVALRCLGQATTGLHCAAGRTGQEVQVLLANYGIQAEAVWVGGETRTAHIIAEIDLHRHSHIFTGGLEISPQQLAEFFKRYAALLPAARFMLTGGRLPSGAGDDFFRRLVEMAASLGVPSLVDSWGDPLLASLEVRPTIVKLNRDEFSRTFNVDPQSMDELRQAAAGIFTRYQLKSLVVTCGSDGMLACTPEGGLYARAPVQTVVSAAGAGDAASGALAWRLASAPEEGWKGALAWAAAVSAASVLTEGTSDLHMADVLAFLPQVSCEQFRIREEYENCDW